MDYTASQYQNTITSKSTLVPSDNQLAYKSGETIRFSVPPFMSFIDPRQSVLKMKVKVRGSSIYRFPKKIGVQSVINNMRIYDGTQTHTLENLQNYAERLTKEYHYTENNSVKHKRDLLEGSESVVEDGFYNLRQNEKQPSAVFNASQLGNGYANTGLVNAAPELDGATILANPNTMEVVLPLSSGILGTMSKRMFPAALTQGLQVEIDTNLAAKCLEVWSEAGMMSNEAVLTGAANPPSAPVPAAFVPSINNFAVKSVVGGAFAPAPTALTTISIFASSIAPAAVAAACRNLAPANRAMNSLEGLTGSSNLLKGRPFFAYTTGVFPATAPELVCVGVIDTLTYNAATDAVDIVLGAIPAALQSTSGGASGQYIPLAAKDVIAPFAAVAVPAATFPESGVCGVSKAASIKECEYELTDIELVLKTAQPPKSYVDGLMRATMSDEGAEYDFMTAETYRNNVNQGEVVAQINLPTLNERAVSIITLPQDQSVANSVLSDNFATTLDHIQNYNYIINGQSQPTRKVSLGRLSQVPSLNEQVALWEIEKSLSTAKLPVRNLNEQGKEFLMARPLALYGGVYNLAADGNISLKVEYSATEPPTENKLFTSYIYGLRRIRVNKVGLSVEL